MIEALAGCCASSVPLAERAAVAAAVLTAGVATVALGLSARANRIAEQNFRSTARALARETNARNEAQARLVWAEFVREDFWPAGTTAPAYDDEMKEGYSRSYAGKAGGLVEAAGVVPPTARADLRIVTVRVVNDSNELIGPFQVKLVGRNGTEDVSGSIGLEGVRNELVRA